MQTKKRAKAVKFNNKEVELKAIKDIAREIEEKVEKKKETSPASAFDVALDGESDAGLMAQTSSTVQTPDKEKKVASRGKISAISDKKATKKPGKTESDGINDQLNENIEEKADIEPSKLDLQKTSQEILSDEAPEEEITKDYPLEKDQAFFNQPPDGVDKKKSSLPYFFTIMVITFIVGLAFFAGIYYAVNNKAMKFLPFDRKT